MALEDIFNVKGKRVLITGATGFFGKAIVEAFLSASSHVIAISRSENKIGELRHKLKGKYSTEMSCYVADFYDRPLLKQTLE